MVGNALHVFESEFYYLFELNCLRRCVILPDDGLEKFSMSLKGSSMIWLRHCVVLPVDGWESSPWL